MNKRIDELITNPKWIETLSDEERHEWYLTIKRDLSSFKARGDTQELERAIIEYERRWKRMKAEKPAEGILQRSDFGDAKSYSVGCQCCGSDCEHNIWVEADITGISVTTYTQQKTNWWSKTRWYHIWKLLTAGYVEYEASIIMSQQQALNYADTLRSAIKDVETFRKNKNG